MSKKLTTEEFIRRAKEVHGDKYDYSKVEYVNNNTKVCIICPKHGEFWQAPNSHLQNHGCPYCAENVRFTTEDFIKKAKEIHGDKYDYSKVEYNGNRNSVTIVCPKHGEFRQRVYNHMMGKGCFKCAHELRTIDTKEFIRQAVLKHGDKYDYSKVEYIDTRTKVCIICSKHGEFWQNPQHHLSGGNCPNCMKSSTQEFIEKAKEVHGDLYDYSKTDYFNCKTNVDILCNVHGVFSQTPNSHLSGRGCPKCARKRITLGQTYSVEHFLEKANKVHGDRYDYSKIDYVDYNTKICIACREHGEFWQTPSKHACGQGCPKCANEEKGLRQRLSKEEFIAQSQKTHGILYDYSKVKYCGRRIPVCIICPRHGEFWQTPNNHMRSTGCPKCNISKLEKAIGNLLTSNQFDFIPQYKIKEDGVSPKFYLSLDFFMPEYNIGIECQGVQHYKPVKFFGGEEAFKIRKILDNRKRKLCEHKGIKLLYFGDEQFDDEIITDTNVLLEKIRQHD